MTECCKICNELFDSYYKLFKHIKKHSISYENYVVKYYYNDESPICKCGCGEKLKFRRTPPNWFSEYKHNHAPKNYTNEYIKNWKIKCRKTNNIKYGSDYYTNREKAKITNLKLYGDKYYNNVDKIKKTKLKRYGVENYTNFELCKLTKKNKYGDEYYTNRNKYKTTCMEKYGVDSTLADKEIFNKTLISKNKNMIYKIENILNKLNLELLNDYNGVKNIKYKFKCKICKFEFIDDFDNGRLPICLKCNPHTISNIESEILNYIKSIYTGIIIQSDRKILNGKELDIYVPEENLAIEFNGLLYHGEIFGKKDRNYHINKTEKCEKKGIQLIHIFEDEWLNKKEIVKNMLKSKLIKRTNTIYGRDCEVGVVDNVKSNEFLYHTHIQGSINSKINIGLFYNNDLVSILCLSKSRFNKNYSNTFEILRYSSKNNVAGGFNKLLSYFIKNHTVDSIISYVDRRFSTKNNIYSKNKFNLIKKSFPAYHYIDNKRNRYNRLNFRKNILKNKLSIFDETLTEWQNMQLNGYDRIWDCGTYKYELKL